MRKILFALLLFASPAFAGPFIPPSAPYVGPPQSTFASLPAASTKPGQVWLATDVGANGCEFISVASAWTLLNGTCNMFSSGLPMILPSSGSIAVTTGVLTLTTALDATYANAYMWFPANAWTGSTAGMYYVTCSTASSCIVHSNQYTSGMPTIPVSPTLVTTGAGAYTQTTGSYLTVLSLPVSGGVMGTTGQLAATYGITFPNNANGKNTNVAYGSANDTEGHNTQVAINSNYYIQNRASASVQNWRGFSNTITGQINSGQAAINTANAQNFIFQANLATAATDWLVYQSINVQLTR